MALSQFGVIMVGVNIAPWFIWRSIHDAALKPRAKRLKGADIYGVGEAAALS